MCGNSNALGIALGVAVSIGRGYGSLAEPGGLAEPSSMAYFEWLAGTYNLAV